jgi:hypothetical protein
MGFFRKKASIFPEKEEKFETNSKKTEKKAKVKKNSAKTIEIVDASSEACFWVNEGGVLKNLHDLQDALVIMTDEQFAFHTKRDGNDFAKWVEGVFGLKDLAKKIAKAKSKKGVLVALNQYIG